MTLSTEEVAMIQIMRTARHRLRILAEIRMLPKSDIVILLVEAMVDSAPELLEFLKRMQPNDGEQDPVVASEKPAVQP